jgi:hypothetical protein
MAPPHHNMIETAGEEDGEDECACPTLYEQLLIGVNAYCTISLANEVAILFS